MIKQDSINKVYAKVNDIHELNMLREVTLKSVHNEQVFVRLKLLFFCVCGRHRIALDYGIANFPVELQIYS